MRWLSPAKAWLTSFWTGDFQSWLGTKDIHDAFCFEVRVFDLAGNEASWGHETCLPCHVRVEANEAEFCHDEDSVEPAWTDGELWPGGECQGTMIDPEPVPDPDTGNGGGSEGGETDGGETGSGGGESGSTGAGSGGDETESDGGEVSGALGSDGSDDANLLAPSPGCSCASGSFDGALFMAPWLLAIKGRRRREPQ
jgi:hypothetical protein